MAVSSLAQGGYFNLLALATTVLTTRCRYTYVKLPRNRRQVGLGLQDLWPRLRLSLLPISVPTPCLHFDLPPSDTRSVAVGCSYSLPLKISGLWMESKSESQRSLH